MNKLNNGEEQDRRRKRGQKHTKTDENDNRWMKIHPPQHSHKSDKKSFLNTQVYRVQNKVLLTKEGQTTQVHLQYNESLSK